jgi:hypothetical protein
VALGVVVAAVSPYVTAGFGLLGSLIGGGIAAGVTVVVARQARDAASSAWMRDTRRQTYDRFLTGGQEYLVACEKYRSSSNRPEARIVVEQAHSTFFEAYSVVQFVAERPVVDTARIYGYRLLQLRFETIGGGPTLGPQAFGDVATLIRLARHDTIDAIRGELGLTDSAKPPDDFSAFDGTHLAQRYREARG